MKDNWNSYLRLAFTSSKDKSLGQRAEVLSGLIGPKTSIKSIKSETIANIVNVLRTRGLTSGTINRYLSIISKVVTIYRRTVDPTFAVYIPWQKEGSGRIEWLNKHDEVNLHGHLANNGMDDLSLVIRILTITGMRLGELLSLEPTQVEDRWIRLWETKTHRPRSVPLPEGLGSSLRALIGRGLPKAHTIRRGLSKALEASGGNTAITPHSLRHTTATRLIKSGVNLMVAQRYLGHNSIKTTQRYVHIEDEDIQTAMERISSDAYGTHFSHGERG